MIKLLILAAQLYAAPKLLGNLISYKDDTLGIGKGPISYVLGLFASFGLFQVVFLPFSLLHGSFTVMCWVYGILLLAVCAVSLYLNREMPNETKRFDFRDLSVQSKLYFIGFVVMVIGQLYFALMFQSNEMSFDDYEYVTVANDNIATDRICATLLSQGIPWKINPKEGLTGWVTFTSYLAKISGVNVATMCHSVLPVVLLVVAYVTYYVVAEFLFKDTELRLVFMLLLSVALTFGFYSHNALSFRLFATLWQGKAVFAAIGVPFLLVVLAKLFDRDFTKRGLVYLVPATIGMAGFSLYASILMCAVFAAMAVLMSIHRRKVTGVWYTVVCSIMPVLQAILYLYIYEVIYGYGIA